MFFCRINLKKEFEKIFNSKIKEILDLKFEDKEGITGKVNMSNPSIYKYRVNFIDNYIDLIIKYKSRKIITRGIKVLNYNKKLKFYYYLIMYHKILSFDYNYIREIKFYREIDESLKIHLPKIRGFVEKPLSDTYMILMDEINNEKDNYKDRLYEIIDVILNFHSKYYNREEAVKMFKLNRYSSRDYKKSRGLFRYMFNVLDNSNFDLSTIKVVNDFIENIYIYHKNLVPHNSLTHNDFNLRNIFLLEDNVIVYDWELSCYQNPEHDLVEFLVFILHYFKDSEVIRIINYFKKSIMEKTNNFIDDVEYLKILEFNILEYIVNKLSVYRIGSKTLKIEFVEQMCININRLYLIVKNGDING